MSATLEKWLRTLNANDPLAVILGGSVNGLSFARSLGRNGVPALMLDSERFLGLYTRYAKTLVLPAVDEYPEQWLDLLEFIGSRLATPGVLFTTSDASCLLVARHREMLQSYFLFVVPEADVVERLVNKRSQYEAARQAGIPIPQTRYPESIEDARLLAPDIPYPCIVKPYRSEAARKHMGGRKVVVVDSPAELISTYADFAAIDVSVMVQEIIPGEDTDLYGYLAFWGRDGHELASLTKRKLRQYPRHYGDGSLQVTVEVPQVAEQSARFLRALNYGGFVCAEFKFDARDATYRLIEFNPRTASGNQLAITAGVDFPWLGYRYLIGADLGATGPARGGVKYLNEEWDIQAYQALRKTGEIDFWGWLDSIRGSHAWAVGAKDDPLPLIAGFGRFLKRLARQR